jgi:hypothetical protein
VRKRLFAFGLTTAMVIALPIAAASPVAPPGPTPALAPIITTFHSEGTDVPVEDCGSFTVLLSFSHDETITTFLDKSGTAIREQVRFNFSGTFTNSVTGKTAFENGDYTIIMDLNTGEAKDVGLVLLIRLRGVGVVTLELGQVTSANGVVSESGGPKILDGGSFICSILS